MRGNRLARGGDPMKTRRERRVERQRKIGKSKRAQRLRRRLGHLAAKNFTNQEENHMTALMESYILRRKAERKKELEECEKLKNNEQDMSNWNSSNSKDCENNIKHKVDMNKHVSNDGNVHDRRKRTIYNTDTAYNDVVGNRQTSHDNTLQRKSGKTSSFPRSLYEN